jgi:hypothetical protein
MAHAKFAERMLKSSRAQQNLAYWQSFGDHLEKAAGSHWVILKGANTADGAGG